MVAQRRPRKKCNLVGLEELGVAYHVGQVRTVNQDSLAVLVPGSGSYGVMLVIADGMGGHQGGQIASSRVVSDLAQWFQSPEVAHWLQELTPEQRTAALPQALQDQLLWTNQALFQWGQQEQELAKMGTTTTVVYFHGEVLIVVHVGDSRAYLWRQGHLYPLTTDHSWIADQVRQGLMKEEQAQQDRRRNRLLRAMGTRPHVEIDQRSHPVQVGDLLLLCSDGLTAYVPDNELVQWLTTWAGQPLQLLADQLLHQVLVRGGGDNVSLILARISPAATSKVQNTVMIRREMTPMYEEQMATVNLPPVASPPTLLKPRRALWIGGSLLLWGVAVLLATLSFIPSQFTGLEWQLRSSAVIFMLLSLLVLFLGRRAASKAVPQPASPS